ncbi:MAG: hypothetical protein R3F49_11050 [Planctomycetota bacterium]
MRDALLAEWRASSRRAGLSDLELDELQDHLESALDASLEAAVPMPKAWAEACARLGRARELEAEFLKLQPTMHPISKLLGVSLSVTLCVLVASPSASIVGLIHPPSLLLVVGLVTIGLLAGHGPRAVADALASGLDRGARPAATNSASQRAVARHGHRLAWAAGVLGVILGTITCLQELTDPSALGAGLATALMSLLYAAMLAELGFANLAQWLERAHARTPAPGGEAA